MSGTSLDAVDAAIVLTDGERVFEYGPCIERKYSDSERGVLEAATLAARQWQWTGPPPARQFEAACHVITRSHADAWRMLLACWHGPDPVCAGIHGQTVLHQPPAGQQAGKTLQLIDAPALRQALGVAIIHDFRSADMAAGGQGAPLAPAYHGALLASLGNRPNAALNLGGVANITLRAADGALSAFDTGPANGPIDEWVQAHGKGSHDHDGAFARAGTADAARLAKLLANPWFALPAPKSLDRYDFDKSMADGLGFLDGCATLTAFTAHAVARSMAQLPTQPDHVVLCGGGRRNPVLVEHLRAVLKPSVTLLAEDVGWRGDAIEAEAFAVLAARRLRNLASSWPTTTGVAVATVGGRILPLEAA